SVRNFAEDKSITIHTEFDRSSCPISADSGRMQQVFRNLLTNAIKFTPPGGTITVRTMKKNDPERIEIQVQDTGKGIKPEFLPYLFTRFSQEDSTTKRVFGGVGLGLSIVRTLVEMHGGTVSASSPGEGKGGGFTVKLPCVSGGPALADDGSRYRHRPVGKNSKSENLLGLRLLVIDDLEEAREVFSVILHSSGAEVETAESA